MSRGTRGRMRVQPQPNEEDDLTLMLLQSQSSNSQIDELREDDDDDFHLPLSQSQSQLQSETLGELDDPTVSDLAYSIASVQNNIKLHFLVKQNYMLLNLISDMFVNVSDISDKVTKLERTIVIMNKTVKNTKEDVESLKKATRLMKQKQAKTIASDEYAERLKHAERKLKLLENKNEMDIRPTSDGNLNTGEHQEHQEPAI